MPITDMTASSAFGDVTLAELDAADMPLLDELSFGVVGLDRDGLVLRYNITECELAGLPRESVLGQNFFLSVGVCMNNFLVAQRFEDEPTLDATLDYVLTFRMRPTSVKLRLLQHPGTQCRYVLIQC